MMSGPAGEVAGIPGSPRSLRSAEARAARLSMLALPHMEPLCRLVERLRSDGRGVVPDFDPMDGGVAAEVFFLLEKPGPMTDAGASGRAGSGFVSRDNDDPTAEAIFRFAAEAGIARRRSVIWNTVPWWNGTRSMRREEVAAGVDHLEELLDLLPHARLVIGVGRKAARAEQLVRKGGLAFLSSMHPSPINRAARPVLWASIPREWEKARLRLDQATAHDGTAPVRGD
nr:uracil-DNA glycosylase [Cereibacter sphaeroides f. sp. denitrificans]